MRGLTGMASGPASLRAVRLAVCVSLALVAGCGHKAPLPPEPAAAKEALQTALDAWQQGVAPESLMARQPAIIVSDHEWQERSRLLAYEVLGDANLHGSSRRCAVRLVMDGTAGQPVQKEVIYEIGA